ncbi:pyrophosphate--fructose-6-phosphate 1-phosphotransferase [Taklimakanibacter lacteus]|uniref:pyrophosphate--fructose-6-phosphate 1-phosphotransferase n=1 Tax=Taklimakanibacter lacteus TaxID=2268456 RepID=UPI000E670F12
MVKIAMLTAGGLAPCLSSAIGGLIERYSALAPEAEIIGYRYGYQGVLTGDSLAIMPEARKSAHLLHAHGGSPIGNSRVKLTNAKDLAKRGLIKDGEDPLAVAAAQLVKDKVTILHTIGGDDTNTTAADLAAFLAGNGHGLTVVGLPKTIDNDIFPIRQSLGALTAAEQGAIFFENATNERTTAPRTLVIHEIMGRHSGWLAAATARSYRERLRKATPLPAFAVVQNDIDALYVPELPVDIEAEAGRLKAVMERKGSVAIFLSEGAGVADLVREMEARGEAIERDAFGHVKIDKINVGDWFSRRFAKLIGAERTLVQKSGYFARSAAANAEDLALIRNMVELAAVSGLKGESGVVGHDEEQGGALRAIEFPRIRGGKPFDAKTPWFAGLLRDIGQTPD